MTTTTFADTLHAARVLNRLLVLHAQVARIRARLEEEVETS